MQVNLFSGALVKSFSVLFILNLCFSFISYSQENRIHELNKLGVDKYVSSELAKLKNQLDSTRTFVYAPNIKKDKGLGRQVYSRLRQIGFDFDGYTVQGVWGRDKLGSYFGGVKPSNFVFKFNQRNQHPISHSMTYSIMGVKVLSIHISIQIDRYDSTNPDNDSNYYVDVYSNSLSDVLNGISQKYYIDKNTINSLRKIDVLVNNLVSKYIKYCHGKNNNFCKKIRVIDSKVSTADSVLEWARKSGLYAHRYEFSSELSQPYKFVQYDQAGYQKYISSLNENKKAKNTLLHLKDFDPRKSLSLIDDKDAKSCDFFYSEKKKNDIYFNVLHVDRKKDMHLCRNMFLQTIWNYGSYTCYSEKFNDGKVISYGLKFGEKQFYIECDKHPLKKFYIRKESHKHNMCKYVVLGHGRKHSFQIKRELWPNTLRTKDECKNDFEKNVGVNRECAASSNNFPEKIVLYSNENMFHEYNCPASNKEKFALYNVKKQQENEKRRSEDIKKRTGIEDVSLFYDLFHFYSKFKNGNSAVFKDDKIFDMLINNFARSTYLVSNEKKKSLGKLDFLGDKTKASYSGESLEFLKIARKQNPSVEVLKNVCSDNNVSFQLYNKRFFFFDHTKRIILFVENKKLFTSNKLYEFKLGASTFIKFWLLSKDGEVAINYYQEIDGKKYNYSCLKSSSNASKLKINNIMSYNFLTQKNMSYVEFKKILTNQFGSKLNNKIDNHEDLKNVEGDDFIKYMSSKIPDALYISEYSVCADKWLSNPNYFKKLFPKLGSISDIKYHKLDYWIKQLEEDNKKSLPWTKYELNYSYYLVKSVYGDDNSLYPVICFKEPLNWSKSLAARNSGSYILLKDYLVNGKIVDAGLVNKSKNKNIAYTKKMSKHFNSASIKIVWMGDLNGDKKIDYIRQGDDTEGREGRGEIFNLELSKPDNKHMNLPIADFFEFNL